MWLADNWKDYELLDCGGGEKLERWGQIRSWCGPTPRPSGTRPAASRGWKRTDGRYRRSSTGGGALGQAQLPEQLDGALYGA